MVEISAEDYDAYVAGAEFVTHFDWSPFRQKFTFGYASLQQKPMIISIILWNVQVQLSNQGAAE
jgi:hypothetical protein